MSRCMSWLKDNYPELHTRMEKLTMPHPEAAGMTEAQLIDEIAGKYADTKFGGMSWYSRKAIIVEAIAEFSSRRAVADAEPVAFDFHKHLQRQREWSSKTFGPDARTQGVVDHIRKELNEVLAKPDDLSEWIDVTILALDGAWRAGYSPDAIIGALVAKQTRNEARVWPDWRTADPNKAIEHDRTTDASPPSQSPDSVVSVPRDDVLREAAAICERRAESIRDGSAVARQCAKDILSMVEK